MRLLSLLTLLASSGAVHGFPQPQPRPQPDDKLASPIPPDSKFHPVLPEEAPVPKPDSPPTTTPPLGPPAPPAAPGPQVLPVTPKPETETKPEAAVPAQQPATTPPNGGGNFELNATMDGVGVKDCSWNSRTGLHPECWGLLEVEAHLNDWWFNKGYKDKCGNSTFAQCYLESAGLITWTCDIISLSTCTPPPSGDSAKYESYQQFYVIWNIYAINQFFAQYHQALLNGQAEAVGTAAEIVKTVSPPKNCNPWQPTFAPIWAATLGIFSAVFVFVPPGMMAFGGLAFAGLLNGGNPVISLLFPHQIVSDAVEWWDISARLSTFVDQYQRNVGEALSLIMRDFGVFQSVTKGGAFSVKLRNTLPKETSYLYRNLLKWTFNQALQARGWFIIKNTGVDPMKVKSPQFTCPGYDEFGVCKDGYIWYDGKDAYGLAGANDIGADFFPKMLRTAFEKNWTTPQELYLDAQRCRGYPATSGDFDPRDMTWSCVSNTPVCEVNQNITDIDHAHHMNNPGPMFTNCPDMNLWGFGFLSNHTYVPYSYLGPFIARKVVYDECCV